MQEKSRAAKKETWNWTSDLVNCKHHNSRLRQAQLTSVGRAASWLLTPASSLAGGWKFSETQCAVQAPGAATYDRLEHTILQLRSNYDLTHAVNRDNSSTYTCVRCGERSAMSHIVTLYVMKNYQMAGDQAPVRRYLGCPVLCHGPRWVLAI